MKDWERKAYTEKFFGRKIDFCTKAPDYILGVYIGSACEQHDHDYANQIGRFKADCGLFMNIARIRWWLFPVAFVYFIGVLLFGSEFY